MLGNLSVYDSDSIFDMKGLKNHLFSVISYSSPESILEIITKKTAIYSFLLIALL